MTIHKTYNSWRKAYYKSDIGSNNKVLIDQALESNMCEVTILEMLGSLLHETMDKKDE